jgi:hypothetical protein
VKPIIVLCPTRDRPERAQEMIWSFLKKTHDESTRMVLGVDDDDPKRADYRRLIQERPNVHLQVVTGGSLTKATNELAELFWDEDVILGHIGDDHLFRTDAWDIRVRERAQSVAVVAPNDGVHQGRIPTACFMSSIIPRTLDWMALPISRHLYIDDVWRVLGMALDIYHYLPQVLIEHMHPAVNKAAWDDGYRMNNSTERWERDQAAFEAWLSKRSEADIETLRWAIEHG